MPNPGMPNMDPFDAQYTRIEAAINQDFKVDKEAEKTFGHFVKGLKHLKIDSHLKTQIDQLENAQKEIDARINEVRKALKKGAFGKPTKDKLAPKLQGIEAILNESINKILTLIRTIRNIFVNLNAGSVPNNIAAFRQSLDELSKALEISSGKSLEHEEVSKELAKAMGKVSLDLPAASAKIREAEKIRDEFKGRLEALIQAYEKLIKDEAAVRAKLKATVTKIKGWWTSDKPLVFELGDISKKIYNKLNHRTSPGNVGAPPVNAWITTFKTRLSTLTGRTGRAFMYGRDAPAVESLVHMLSPFLNAIQRKTLAKYALELKIFEHDFYLIEGKKVNDLVKSTAIIDEKQRWKEINVYLNGKGGLKRRLGTIIAILTSLENKLV